MKDRHKYCRRNQIFYSRYFYLDLFENHYRSNELKFFENLLLFDLVYVLNGFIRRYKNLKTKDEVSKYFIKVFSSEFRGDRLMHKYLDDLKFIITLYD